MPTGKVSHTKSVGIISKPAKPELAQIRGVGFSNLVEQLGLGTSARA